MANELLDAQANYISLVHRGANGDPIRVLKSADGEQGLDLAAFAAKSDDGELPEEVVQKLNLLAASRAVATVGRRASPYAHTVLRHVRGARRAVNNAGEGLGIRLQRGVALAHFRTAERAIARNNLYGAGVNARAGVAHTFAATVRANRLAQRQRLTGPSVSRNNFERQVRGLNPRNTGRNWVAGYYRDGQWVEGYYRRA